MSKKETGRFRLISSGRKRWIPIAVIVAALLATGIALAGTQQRDQASTTSTKSAKAAPKATPAPATKQGALNEDEASKVIAAALAAPISSATTDASLKRSVAPVATDSYAAELLAQWQELDAEGWAIKGVAKPVSVQVSSVDLKKKRPTATVIACIDSANVSMVDANKRPIGKRAKGTARAKRIMTLVQSDDRTWQVSSQRFDDNPAC